MFWVQLRSSNCLIQGKNLTEEQSRRDDEKATARPRLFTFRLELWLTVVAK